MSDTKPEPGADELVAADPTTIIDVDPKAGEAGYFRVNSDGDLMIGNRVRGNGGRALVVNPDRVPGLVINFQNDFKSVMINGVKPGSSPVFRSLLIDTTNGSLWHEP